MPLVALICSPTTSTSQLTAKAKRKPMKKPGKAPGRMTCRVSPHRLSPNVAADSTSRPSTLRMRSERVDVNGERHAERDQGDLRLLADAEPHDRERQQGEHRQRAEDLHRPVDEVLAEAEQPGDDGEQDARGDTDRRAR